MKMMKSVLAVIMAVCLMMGLAVSAYATEVTATSEATTAQVATEENVVDAAAAATEETVGVEEEAAESDDAVIDFDDLQEAAGETEAVVEDGAAEEEHDHDHETETTGTTEKKPLKVVVIILQVIASLALILVVLAQSGKESGLSGALSGNSDSYMNKSGAAGLDKKLAKATKWVALVWVLLTLVLFLM